MTDSRQQRASRVVVVLLFDEVEVLDFAGPFEVFGVTGRRSGSAPFDVVTVAERHELVTARNGLRISPTFGFDDCPKADVLVIPGGYGTRREMHNASLVDWVASQARRAEVVLSVCTGALLLAKANLLTGLNVTTHHGAFDLLAEVAPHAVVHRGARFLDNGHVVTSAGISAGIDASLHIVARLLGLAEAQETASYMEYRWERLGEDP